MAAIDDIIVWANNLPAWQADAVRRLLAAGEQPLSAQEEDEITALAKAKLGLVSIPPRITPSPPTAGMFSGTPASVVAVQLLSIENIQHVNIIEPGASLSFSDTGVTVVYGSNGAGKSGYARILKLACSARDKEEQILPNVFNAGGGGKPSAVLKIRRAGNPEDILWTQGQVSNPVLTNVTVFDARCARIITDERSEITYLPYGADVFEKFVALILRIKAVIESETVNLEPLQDSGVLDGSPSAAFLETLSEKMTSQDIATQQHGRQMTMSSSPKTKSYYASPMQRKPPPRFKSSITSKRESPEPVLQR